MEADHPRFAEALAALDGGDLDALRALLGAQPELVRARVTSDEPPYEGYFHRATLLHHVAGNPIRDPLPENAVEVARVLLEAGADPDAGCGGGPAQPTTAGGTTLGLVTSGAQPHLRGFSEALIDLLLEHGATLHPDGGMFGSLYHTVEHRGQREVARMLFERGVRADLPTAAGLGELDLVRSFFDGGGRPAEDAGDIWRRSSGGAAEREGPDAVLADALLAGATCGWPDVVSWLLERGADIGAARRWGPFAVTPLHGAAWAGWPDVVALLLERGADPTARDPHFDTTPYGWADHCDRTETLAAFRAAAVEK